MLSPNTKKNLEESILELIFDEFQERAILHERCQQNVWRRKTYGRHMLWLCYVEI